jgi:class 3 adenylate cyclase
MRRQARKGDNDAMPGEDLERPPTDVDRARAIDRLRAAGSRLGLDEAERRMDMAVRAASVGELAVLVWDLPEHQLEPARREGRMRGALRNAGFRAHATAYGLTNGLLVGTWALTGHGFFWPFFPIAGWGIGLGMHAVGVETAQRHKEASAARRLARAPQPPPQPVQTNRKPELTRSRVSTVVMFTDIVDSTRLTAIIGDEDWTRIRARHRELLHRCYDSHNGTEVNSHGDGFLSRFSNPADAVLCATEIQLRLLDERRELGFAPSVRIGINAGDAVDEGGDLLGTVVNVAARIMALADPGEIFVTETVADRLDDRFRLDDRGLRDVKGLDRSCHVLAVRWAG